MISLWGFAIRTGVRQQKAYFILFSCIFAGHLNLAWADPAPPQPPAPAPKSAPDSSASTPSSNDAPPAEQEKPEASKPEAAPPATEGYLNVRDPFRAPKFGVGAATILSGLETISLDSLRLTGVITGPKIMKALLKGPGGKTYFVTEKMKIGTNSGYIRKITPDKIYVRERTTNPLGQVENLDVELPLIAQSTIVEDKGDKGGDRALEKVDSDAKGAGIGDPSPGLVAPKSIGTIMETPGLKN